MVAKTRLQVRALTAWAECVLTLLTETDAHRLEGIAIDGKTLCGSCKQEAEDSHLFSCISQTLGIVVSQVAVSDKTNEITKVADLIERLVLTGKVVSGDALLTQHSIAENMIARGGDYLFVMKDT